MTEAASMLIYIAIFGSVFLFGAFILKRDWNFWGGTLVGLSGLALCLLAFTLML